MKKHRLNPEALAVESFGTLHPVDGECVCDYPPCICSAGPDCTDTR